jgi:hypothetical protein
VREDATSNYERAAEAFLEAAKLRIDRPEYLVSVGRCQYRSVAYARRTSAQLDDHQKQVVAKAKESLLKVRGKAAESRDAAEACRYLGLIGRDLELNLTEADRFLGEAVSRAEKSYPRLWPIAVEDWMDVAWRRLVKDLKDTTARDDVRSRAELLLKRTDDKHANAAYYLGKTYEYEDKPKDAVAAYSRALPADLKRAGPEHLSLLLARVECYLVASWARDLKPNPAAVIAEADRAAEIAKGAASARLKANALGVAALARHNAVSTDTAEEERVRLREEARDRARDAVKLEDPQRPFAGKWQGLLAWQLKILSQEGKYADKAAEYRREARELFDEAIKNPSTPRSWKNLFKDLRGEL